MTEESINNVLGKFPKLDDDIKLLSDEELQHQDNSHPPIIRDTKHALIKELLSYDIKKKKYIRCGHLVGLIFYRYVKPEHYILICKGYGIQEDAFLLMVERGYKHVALIKEEWTPMTENGKQFNSLIEDWVRYKWVVDLGHGRQQALPEKHMTLSGQIVQK